MLKDPELAAAYDDTKSILEATSTVTEGPYEAWEDRRLGRLCSTLCLMLRVLDKLAQDAESLRIVLKGHYHEPGKAGAP